MRAHVLAGPQKCLTREFDTPVFGFDLNKNMFLINHLTHEMNISKDSGTNQHLYNQAPDYNFYCRNTRGYHKIKYSNYTQYILANYAILQLTATPDDGIISRKIFIYILSITPVFYFLIQPSVSPIHDIKY
jgi:hypothetical protein